jgi:hypothetical protein
MSLTQVFIPSKSVSSVPVRIKLVSTRLGAYRTGNARLVDSTFAVFVPVAVKTWIRTGAESTEVNGERLSRRIRIRECAITYRRQSGVRPTDGERPGSCR